MANAIKKSYLLAWRKLQPIERCFLRRSVLEVRCMKEADLSS